MKDIRCPLCSSSRVVIVDSEETREVITIRCLDCGRHSYLDTENDHTDPGDVTPLPANT